MDTIDGVLTPHLVRAAIHAASLLSPSGASRQSLSESYTHYASGGVFAPDDLRLGEQVLALCGLVWEESGLLYPTQELLVLLSVGRDEALEMLLARWVERSSLDRQRHFGPPALQVATTIAELVPDPDRREALLLSLGKGLDSDLRAQLGERGEEAVVALARLELTELGRGDLAKAVQRVSLISDRLGYDVTAPSLNGPTRRMEVKTATALQEGVARLFLSRNEADVGRRDPNWALVVCTCDQAGSIVVVGWCRASAILPYLPIDSMGGIWSEAKLAIPVTLLTPGVPSAYGQPLGLCTSL